MSNDSSSFQKPITANITAAAQTLDITSPNQATEIIQAQGTWAGTLVAEGSNDGTNFYILNVLNANSDATGASITANGVYACNTNGFQFVRLRSSAWTSGTANITVYGSDSASLLNTNSVLRNTSGTEVGTATNPFRVDPIGATTQPVSVVSIVEVEVKNDSGNPLPVSGSLSTSADFASGYSPDYSSRTVGNANLLVDGSQRLETHSTVTTDEGSYRTDFSGSSLVSNLTGTASFTNGSTTVTATGASFTTLKYYDYIKFSTDANTAFAQIAYIVDDDTLELTSPYTGSTASGTANYSEWIPSIGAGGSITMASGFLNLISGTSSGSTTYVQRFGDYPPYLTYSKFSISQRIANQTISWGFVDNVTSISKQARFIFTGTNNQQVICQTSFSALAADIQSTTVTLPTGVTTASINKYEINLTANQVSFLVNGKVVAVHQDHIPGPYDNLIAHYLVSNSAAVTSTTLAIDYFFFENVDQVQVTSDFNSEPIPTTLWGINSSTGLPVQLALDSNGNLIVSPLGGVGADFAFGDVTTSSTTPTPMRRTTYTEQTTNAQRSIASANANDTGAGTGAQQVTITYFDQLGAGPFTETLTLNGTTGVNTVNTNICFIEEIKVTRVGSGGVAAGIITLYAGLNKTGAVIGTITAGTNQTFWAHHYVATGKTCRISGISGSTDQTSSAYALIYIRAQGVATTGAPEVQVSDSVRVYGGASETVRNYNSPILVSGPARVTLFVQASSNSAQSTFGAFDFTES